MTPSFRVRPVGEAALSLELGDGIDPGLTARVQALDQRLVQAPFPGFRESVPTYRSLLVCYDPSTASMDEVRAHLESLAARPSLPPRPGRLHQVPVHYGGDDGPDLPAVAVACRRSEEEVVARHSAPEYAVFMLGFMPGFAYLGLLPPDLELPRRATPRVRVPAGSVAIAGCQTAIYPAATPGGWHLIGRTSLPLFDATAEPPALFQPGDRVRFVPVDRPPDVTAATTTTSGRPNTAAGPAILEVLDGGLLTTVQDGGRFGYRRWGVGAAGAMDISALSAGNALLGNAPKAAALECTVVGPTLRFLAACRFALTGADLGAVLQRADLGAWPVPIGRPVLARPGNVLAFGPPRSGCRAYVALAGGIDVPRVLGSRSTDLLGGFGGLFGRALTTGDRLAVGQPGTAEPVPAAWAVADRTGPLRVVLGPQDDHFSPEMLGRFLAAEYVLGPASDRVGGRLQGPRLVHQGPDEIVSDAMLPGSVQVPPDGQPIVMMADAPTTGGYPKIATVVRADLPRLAQLRPGQDVVRFAAVSVEEAGTLGVS